VHFHTANRVREHIYLPEIWDDEAVRIRDSDGLQLNIVAQRELASVGQRCVN
jgi:hypothetical protein